MENKLHGEAVAVGRILLTLQKDLNLYKHKFEKDKDPAMQAFWSKLIGQQSYIISNVVEIIYEENIMTSDEIHDVMEVASLLACEELAQDAWIASYEQSIGE